TLAELALAQKSLPNNSRVYELAGLIDRSKARWAEAIYNFERAYELDPKNGPHLVNLGTTYFWLKNYNQMPSIIDRIIAIVPDHKRPRIIRAGIEQDRRADSGPLRAVIQKILTSEPGSDKDPIVASSRFDLAFYDRDWDSAANLAAALPQKEDDNERDFWLGVVARFKGDAAAARASFMKARTEVEQERRVHPDDMHLVSR